MKNIVGAFLLSSFFLLITGCNGDSDSNNADAKKDHVWKEQTDTIDKAREVEGMLQDSAGNTRDMIEQQK